MKPALIKVVLTLTIVLLAHPLIHSQLNNSCTYSYSFGKGDKLFAFCLTPYGTLASLAGSSGNNLLDPVNPIEGWAMCDYSGYDLFSPIKVVPGLGLTGGEPPPSVYQPKGVGKLPINFGNGVDVTADPSTKTVVFAMPFHQIGSQGEYAFGSAVRVMGLGSTSATLSTSSVSAFAYVVPNDLVQLSAVDKQVGITTPGRPGVSPGAGWATCGVYVQPNSPGQGFLYNDPGYNASGGGTVVWSYRVF
jgi:hypothetical protein